MENGNREVSNTWKSFWFVDWRWLRCLGQLQLLNLISFSLLIFVPILAGFWPLVRLTVYQYNSVAAESRQQLNELKRDIDRKLESAKEKLDQSTAIADEPMTFDTIQSLNTLASTYTNLIDHLVSNLNLKTAEVPNLPKAWVFSFFASLSILLARTLFELSCPSIVREFNVEGFVESRKSDYAKTPSDWSLEEALQSLSGTDVLPQAREEERRYRIDQNREIDNLINEIQRLEFQLPFIRDNTSHLEVNENFFRVHKIRRELNEDLRFVMEAESGQHSPHFRRRMSIIEESARQKYLATARDNPMVAFACFFLFIAGCFSLLLVVLSQAINVVRAGGWL